MAEGENIGGVNISIGADYSDVLTAFTDIQNQATQAGAAVGQAFAGSATGIADFDDALQKAAQSAGDASAAASGAASGVADLGDSLAATGASATTASTNVEQVSTSTTQAGESAAESSNKFADMAEKLTLIGEALIVTEALKEFALEALNASDAVTHANIAFTAIDGSAAQATATISALEEVANKDALSFPAILTAATRMQQMLGPAADVAEILGHIADGAAVSGKSIDAASDAFTRAAGTGVIMARSIASLGVNLTQLADAYNKVTSTTDATAQNVTGLFKAMDTASQRTEVLELALSNLDGVAQKVKDSTFQGLITVLGNEWESVMIQAGNAILPFLKDLASITESDIIPFISNVMEAFKSLPGPVQEVVVGVGALAAATIPLSAAFAAVGLGITGLNTLLVSLGITSIEATTETGALAVAQASAVAPAEALAVAQGQVVAAEEAGAAATATATTSIASSIGLRLGLYGALAVALASAYGAWKQLQEAEAGVVAQNAELDKSLGVLEITMARQGLDISDLKAQYASGQITLQQFMQGLRDMEVSYTNLHPPMAQAAADAQAHTDKLSLLKNAVKEAQDAVDKLTAAGVSQAGQSDKLLAADNALEAAQKAYNIALQGGHDAAQQAAKDQQEIATDAANVAVMLDKVPASFKAYIASLSAGGAEGKKLESEIDSLITKFEKQAQTADGPVKSALVGMIAQLQAMKEMTAAAESPTDELGNKLLTLSDYIQAARDASIGLSTGTEKLTLDYEDAVNNLLVVHAEYVGGTKKLSDYEKAQNAVTKAQENLNDAEAAAGAKTSEATDDYSLLSVQLAIAKQKLEDVKNAYANDPTLAGKVQAAQREVTTLQNELNTALSQTPSAANAAAAGIDWVAAACGKAINQLFSLTAAIQSTFAAFDSAYEQSLGTVTIGGQQQVNGHTSLMPGQFSANPGSAIYNTEAANPTSAGTPLINWGAYYQQQASAGVYTATQLESLIAAGLIKSGSYTTSSGGQFPGSASGSSNSAVVMGPASVQAGLAGLNAQIAAGGSTVGSTSTDTGTTDVQSQIAFLQAAFDAAEANVQKVITAYDAGTDSLDQLNAATAMAAMANDALYTAVNAANAATGANTSATNSLTTATAASTTAAQGSATASTNVLGAMTNLTSSVTQLTTATVAATVAKNVVGATTAIAGTGVVLGYGVAGTGGGTNVVGTTTSYNNNGGNTPLVFNFQGANFSSASPDMVQAAVTQALRTAGARF
jgi:hypothetical protein